MPTVLSAFVAAILVVGAWRAERAVDQLRGGLGQASRLRYALLDSPRRAVPAYCRGLATQPEAKGCGQRLLWRTTDAGEGDPETGFVPVCAADHAAIDPMDARLRPRRTYEIRLRCPAPLPGGLSREIAFRLTR